MKNQEKVNDNDDEDDSDDDIVYSRKPRAAVVKKNQVDTVSAVKANQLPSSPISKPVYTKFSNHTEKVSKDNIKDTSDSFKMFWFDYAEAENSLLLFGKIMTKEGKLVSGVVKVDGICRELFFYQESIVLWMTKRIKARSSQPLTY